MRGVEPGRPRTGAQDWSVLTDELGRTLRRTRPGQFVLVEFVEHEGVPPWDPWPYAQCMWEPDGWYCEVVSANFLPAERWPLDELTLRRAGWRAPAGPEDNWSIETLTAELAASAMVEALRRGRDCDDPRRYRWEVGTLPADPDGGEPVPVVPLVSSPTGLRAA